MKPWSTLANENSLSRVKKSLENNGMTVVIVKSGQDAYTKVLKLLPKGAEVMTMSSVTLDTIGISREIQESVKYESVKKKLMSMNIKTQQRDMVKLGATPEYALGSVHAITENGELIIASLTGSQQPAYAYGAEHVVFVVGTQKIVTDQAEGFKRIYDYVLPLESERAHNVYGVASSSVNKILIINKESTINRITIILVQEQLGF